MSLTTVMHLVEGDELPNITLVFYEGDPELDQRVDLTPYTEVLITVKSRAGYLVESGDMDVRADQAGADRGKADYVWANGQVAVAGRYWVQARLRRGDLDQTFPDGSEEGAEFLTIEVGERL